MKEIKAYIRVHMLDKVIRAFDDAGAYCGGGAWQATSSMDETDPGGDTCER